MSYLGEKRRSIKIPPKSCPGRRTQLLKRDYMQVPRVPGRLPRACAVRTRNSVLGSGFSTFTHCSQQFEFTTQQLNRLLTNVVARGKQQPYSGEGLWWNCCKTSGSKWKQCLALFKAVDLTRPGQRPREFLFYIINEAHQQYSLLDTIFNYILYLGPPGKYL